MLYIRGGAGKFPALFIVLESSHNKKDGAGIMPVPSHCNHQSLL